MIPCVRKEWSPTPPKRGNASDDLPSVLCNPLLVGLILKTAEALLGRFTNRGVDLLQMVANVLLGIDGVDVLPQQQHSLVDTNTLRVSKLAFVDLEPFSNRLGVTRDAVRGSFSSNQEVINGSGHGQINWFQCRAPFDMMELRSVDHDVIIPVPSAARRAPCLLGTGQKGIHERESIAISRVPEQHAVAVLALRRDVPNSVAER